MTSEALKALAERVEGATGPDRRLDAAIHATFVPGDFDDDADHYATYADANRADLRYFRDIGVPAYTSSIDAALALAQKSLGDQWYGVMLDAVRAFGVAGTLGPDHLARYVTAALLRALQTQPDHLKGTAR